MTKIEINNKLNEYFDLKDVLEDYTSKYHDDIFWDCEGYYEDISILDVRDFNTIESNIKVFKSIIMELSKPNPKDEVVRLLENSINYVYS